MCLQGREHEWLFLQPEGQAEVAASCQARRLIIVSCKRGQTYGTTLEVQQELSPMVRLVALPEASNAMICLEALRPSVCNGSPIILTYGNWYSLVH